MDWRIPTKFELNEMYAQRVAIGGFTLNIYLSSTEFDAGDAWVQTFNGGAQSNSNNNKSTSYHLRAVRAF